MTAVPLRTAAAVAAALAAALLRSVDAAAAGEARLDVFPDRPRAGEPVEIQLRTYWSFRPPRPAIFDERPPLVLSAFGPNGRRIQLQLMRDRRDPHRWRGTLHFQREGRWIVCGANFQFSTRRPCAATNRTRRVVQVRPRGARVDVWHRLQRPFAIGSVGDGAACPTATPDGDLRSRGWDGPAWGPGPAYPVGLGDGPVLNYNDPIPSSSEFFGTGWFGNKVLWFVDRRTYRGPVLVRGRQLDGPNLVRFDRGRVPPRELRISAGSRDTPSYTRVRAAGCYAYQVDGLGFSNTIVFQARSG